MGLRATADRSILKWVSSEIDTGFASRKGSRQIEVLGGIIAKWERFDRGPRLIIVRGLPGSGKTTHAKLLEARLRGVRLSADEWMDALSLDHFDEEKRGKVEDLQWKFGEKLLSLNLTVIIEWGTWGRAERDKLRLGARALGAAVELHYLSESADALFDRIQRRGMENPSIQQADLLRWIEIFQASTDEEMAFFDAPSVPKG